MLAKGKRRDPAALTRLSRARAGSVAVIAAASMVPLLLGAGLAVDYVRLTAVRSELQRAVDAAALAGARVVVSYPPNDAEVLVDARRYFWANFRSGFASARITTDPQVNIVAPARENVQVSATAEVPVILVGALASLLPSHPSGISSLVLNATATAQKYQRGMEMVLALDTTASMATGTRLADLKQGTHDLLDIVYGVGNDERGSVQCVGGPPPSCGISHSLLVGVVPFVATVNVGPARGRNAPMPWIVRTPRIAAVNWGGAGGINNWKGCVMARPAPFEEAQADATPTASPFEPYVWQPTAATVIWGGVTYSGPNPWTTSDPPEYWPDWPYGGGNPLNRNWVGWGAGDHAAGPNKGCGYPLLPLQPKKSIAKTHIDALQVGARNGTTVTLGFSWAWRLLSPGWRPWWEGGLWSVFDGGGGYVTTSTPIGAPRAYDTGFDKVVVLFTDGQNEMGNGTPGSVEACCTNAYGEWSTRPLGFSPVNELNRRTVEVCNAIKAKGVKIFVILLYASPPTTILDIFNENGCASGPNYFFLTPNGSDLRTIFREIGSHLTNLRLVN